MSNNINGSSNPNLQRVLDQAEAHLQGGSEFAAQAHGTMEKILGGGLKLAGAVASMLGGVLGSCGGGGGGM
jgi:hypothetical protein